MKLSAMSWTVVGLFEEQRPAESLRSLETKAGLGASSAPIIMRVSQPPFSTSNDRNLLLLTLKRTVLFDFQTSPLLQATCTASMAALSPNTAIYSPQLPPSVAELPLLPTWTQNVFDYVSCCYALSSSAWLTRFDQTSIPA